MRSLIGNPAQRLDWSTATRIRNAEYEYWNGMERVLRHLFSWPAGMGGASASVVVSRTSNGM